MYVDAYTHTRIHIYIYTHTHTYTHYTHQGDPPSFPRSLLGPPRPIGSMIFIIARTMRHPLLPRHPPLPPPSRPPVHPRGLCAALAVAVIFVIARTLRRADAERQRLRRRLDAAEELVISQPLHWLVQRKEESTQIMVFL